MGFSIFVINLTGTWMQALMAGFLQATYSFSVIFFTTRICRHCLRFGASVAVLTPSILTAVFTYLLHLYGNSPQPFFSALFSFIVAIVSFIIMVWRFNKTEATLFQLLKNWWFENKVSN